MDLATAGLRIQPFQTRDKPLIFIPYAAQRLAFDVLKKTHRHRHGLALFQGPSLSGKTTMLSHFARLLPSETAVAVVDGAGLEAGELMQAMLSRFGYELCLVSTNELLSMIRVFAMQQSATSHAPLVIIENVHALNPCALEALCELAVLKVNDQCALRLVFASSQSIKPIVRAAAMKPILDRLTVNFQLGPLTCQETLRYLHTKLRSGGCNNPETVLPQNVCNKLHAAAQGWPGVLDRLTLRALEKAKFRPVQVAHIEGRAKPADKVTELPVLRPVREKPEVSGKGNGAPRIIVTNRGKLLRKMSLDSPRLLIGRSEHNDLRIDDELISRNHALFIRSDKTTFVMDLNSTNGTYVNGKRVSNQVVIDNDIVSLGEVRIKFIDPGARVRTTLEGSGFNETMIAKTLDDVRNVLARRQS